jgi:uncharacterized protein YkwD
MRILSWIGAFVLFVAVAYGTSAALSTHPANTAIASSLIAGGPVLVVDGGDLPHTLPSPSTAAHAAAPKPAPKPAPKAAAPVARATSAPAIVIHSTQQALINKDRVSHGLRPLIWSSCLASIAYSNALRMANQGYISHTNGATRDLGCHVGYHAGENVGWHAPGINDTWANTAFMNSPEHRANILSSYYHYVATYWVMGSGGRAYIAVEFS